MAQEERRAWWSLLRWPVALGVLAWLIGSNRHGLGELMSAGVLWRWIVLAVCLRFAAICLASARWDLLLKGQEIDLPFARVFRVFATGYVCNFVLPGTVGGDVARAGMIAARSRQRAMRGAATVPLDRLLGLLAFIVVGAIAGLIQWPHIPPGILQTSVILLICIATAGISGLLVLLVVRFPGGAMDAPKVEVLPPIDEASISSGETQPTSEDQHTPRKAGHELLFGLALLRESRRSVLVACLFALVGHSCLSMSMYCCLRAFPAAEIPAGAISHLWIVPSAEVPAALLPLPGGVGAREGVLAVLYGALSDEMKTADRYQDVGVIVAATYSTVSVGLAILIAIGLTLTGGMNTRADKVTSPPQM